MLKNFDFEELLVATVQNYPILYNLKNPQYRNKKAKENVWANIGRKLNHSAKECTVRWKSLRSQYLAYLRKLKISKLTGSGLGKRPYFRHSEIMQFIEDTSFKDTQSLFTESSCESTSSVDVKYERFTADAEDSEVVESAPVPPIPLNGKLCNPWSTDMAEQPTIGESYPMHKISLKRKSQPFEEELVKDVNTHEKPCEDEFDHYGKFIAAKLRKIGAESSKTAAELEIKIQEIILEAVSEDIIIT